MEVIDQLDGAYFAYFEPCKEQEATKLKRRMERLFHMKTCQARILCDDYDSPKYW
ncbi:hypothetical protein BofuT4_uP047170.1 [Botrytis cinerea T4]|uniref:Uncharacterized protein n=1 Tax=Botryotinia fuckeliana (strain T4) TaxID=999810 RepID=G2XZ12_BOTF4|nr:hypothetical protein BofuT4_uP047170.1 [Botrytis cinerea T4]